MQQNQKQQQQQQQHQQQQQQQQQRHHSKRQAVMSGFVVSSWAWCSLLLWKGYFVRAWNLPTTSSFSQTTIRTQRPRQGHPLTPSWSLKSRRQSSLLLQQRVLFLSSSETTTNEIDDKDMSDTWSEVEEWNLQEQGWNASQFASWLQNQQKQERPLLLRHAFCPEKEEQNMFWPTWHDIWEMAHEDDCECRLVSHVPGDETSFDVQWSLFEEAENDELSLLLPSSSEDDNGRCRTLVVNDVDRWFPPLADWMDHHFSTVIPHWKRDDGQVSLAGPGGGIGPHVDNYHVFLIQMAGSRLWQVGRGFLSPEEELRREVPNLPVRILSGWNRKRDYLELQLEPGDCLFLPPRVAHCGLAPLDSSSQTLSVGWKTPSMTRVLGKLVQEASSERPVLATFKTMETTSPGLISDDVTLELKRQVQDALQQCWQNDALWTDFCASLLTEAKRSRSPDYPVTLSCEQEAQDILERVFVQNQGALYQAEGVVFGYTSAGKLYVDGQSIHQDNSQNTELWVAWICNHRQLTADFLTERLGRRMSQTQDTQLWMVLKQLVWQGYLYYDNDDDNEGELTREGEEDEREEEEEEA